MNDKTIYKDRKGEQISYGDILRNVHLNAKDYDSPYATKMPFFMLTKLNDRTMMYCSAGDEYLEISDCKTKTDKIDELSAFEIFAHRNIYEGLNNDR